MSLFLRLYPILFLEEKMKRKIFPIYTLTNWIPGDLQLNENEHLQCSKLVGSPFLLRIGFSHEGTGPVRIPIDEPPAGGCLRIGAGEFPAGAYSSDPGRGANCVGYLSNPGGGGGRSVNGPSG